jgi:hypothetical protein
LSAASCRRCAPRAWRSSTRCARREQWQQDRLRRALEQPDQRLSQRRAGQPGSVGRCPRDDLGQKGLEVSLAADRQQFGGQREFGAFVERARLGLRGALGFALELGRAQGLQHRGVVEQSSVHDRAPGGGARNGCGACTSVEQRACQPVRGAGANGGARPGPGAAKRISD